jgi:lactoylglutathione lyase
MAGPSLGWIVLYVDDVAATVDRFVTAFGLTARFVTPDGDYGELDTGSTTLGVCARSLAADSAGIDVGPPNLGFNITLVTDDVPAAYARALEHDMTALKEPTTKPWGQTVSYVTTPEGFIVELATAVS